MRMLRALDSALTVVFSLVAALSFVRPAHAVLEADLTSNLVAIKADFFGDNITLFGTIPDKGDVIVVVRGPSTDFKMHRKSNVGGIWINTWSMTFEDVPSFYAIASSAPLDDITNSAIRALNGIGVDYIGLDLPSTKASGPLAEAWKQGLLRNLTDLETYQLQHGKIRFLGDSLFRTEFSLPSNVPIGSYGVTIYHLQDGRVVDARTVPLSVEKVGLEAEIYDFAYNQSAYYGVVAAIIALIAGWLGHIVFRR